MTNQVQKHQSTKSIANFLNQDSTTQFLKKTIGNRKGEFISNLIAITDQDKNLAKCSPADVMKCALNATALDLPLNKNLGYAYVIPYGTSPQFQIGYKGFIQLALRSGQYEQINISDVREGEIEFNKFTGNMTFIEMLPENDIIGYLAYLKLTNGFFHYEYWTKGQVEAHAKKYSQTYKKYGSGLWKDEFDKMAKKTVLKSLLNTYGVMSVQMQNAIKYDQADHEGKYVDNIRDNQDAVIQQADIVEDANIIDSNTLDFD